MQGLEQQFHGRGLLFIQVERFVVGTLLFSTFFLIFLFPFDFARERLGLYYVPWVVFPIAGLGSFLLLRILAWRATYYDKVTTVGSFLFLLGLFLPVEFGRPFSPMVFELGFYLSVPLILFNALSNQKLCRTVVLLLITGSAGLALVGLLRIAVGHAAYFSFEPPQGLGTRNSAAFILEGVYFFALSASLWAKRLSGMWKAIARLATVLILIAVLLSFSRGTWIAMTIGHLVILLSFRKRFAKVVILAFILMSVLSILWQVYPTALERIASRAMSTFTLSKEGRISNYSRWILLLKSWEKIKLDPFIGIGAGNFPQQIHVYKPTGRQLMHPHNAYVQIWLENGIFGLTGFLLILLAPFNILRKVRPNMGNHWLHVGAKATMVSYALHLLFASFYNMLYFWIIYGVVLSLIHRLREANERVIR